ncbi:solute carrier organic anion transporter family member 74D-like isoform X2 [Pectinophora gossypiella]|nr:solute carrier organic anion transporter family member 74D-like isoform X2 [Pectinophora gossypiella]XP_049873368.1 solute carrier organic anion transporter family member 74D-like isoform X2 [Pectinophora gossypiella]
MKGVEATPEEQERLATGNNNGSLDCKLPSPQPAGPRSVFYSTRVFMLVFLSGWVLQGMFLTYFVSVTTTIEKLYRVESRTTGTLLAATEIGQICTALFLTYLAGRGHRPRWIACMMLVLAVGVVGCVVPHMLYGTRLLDVHLDTHRVGAAPVCSQENATSYLCDSAHVQSTEARSSMTAIILPWLFFCLLVVGVGQTGIATLGIPYVDDNVGSRQSPLYMAITIGIRVIGPALGFLLGALCTRVYVDPLFDPGYEYSDPRWVGAWWLGMVFIAGFIVLLSALMFFFPRQIKPELLPPPPKKTQDKNDPPFFKDFFATIKRQLTNDILMWRTASSVLHLMPISGVYSFLPKYLEKQFRLPTHDANLVSGLGGILVMGLGIITSGVVIVKLVPTARQVAAWTAATAAIYSAGMVILMFVSCPEESFRLLSTPGNNATLACSQMCNCDEGPYTPVCGQDSFTYLSPCQAGCESSEQLDNSTWLYYNCSCIDANILTDGAKAIEAVKRYDASWNASHGPLLAGGRGVAVSGECGAACGRIYAFIAIFATLMFVHASGEVGAVLLIIRCTDKHDKAMAMGVIQFAIGVFGNVPCPIVFGAAIDAACRLRDVACGVTGACASYDNDSLRHFFLGLSAALMFLAFIMDMLVWSKAGRIDMNPGDPAPDHAPLRPKPNDTQL